MRLRRREFLRVAAVGGVGTTTLSFPGAAAESYAPLGSVAIENAKEAVVRDDGTAFVATTDGFATVDVNDPAKPTVLAERRGLLENRDDGPMKQIWDVKVEGDRLLVAGPANPVKSEVFHGFLLYDVSDPKNPKRVAVHGTEFPIHNAVLRGDVAYLTGNNGEGNPLVMVNVEGDDPEEVGRWSMLDHDSAWSEVDAWVRTLHDLWVQDGVAYLAQWDAGTWVVDVSDPGNPKYRARLGGRSLDDLASIPDGDENDAVIGLPGNDHFVTVNEDASLLAINKEAWDANPDDEKGGPGGVELWDISTLDSPTKLSSIDPPASPDPTYSFGVAGLAGLAADGLGALSPVGVGAAHGGCHDCTGGSQGSGVWTTSHNFDLVGDHLYTSWYQGGVKLFDVSDPANPKELAWWRDPEKTAFWTAQHLDDDCFVASSMGRHGNGKGGLYTFPNHAGEQANPPKLVGNGNGSEKPSVPQQSATETTTTTEEGDVSATNQPGLGVAAGAAAVALGAWAKLRKRDD